MRVIVVGGGVIGLACAWRLAEASHDVVLIDDHRRGAASLHGAGMLAPVTEAHFGEEPLLALNLESARQWARFADDVERASGRSVGFRTDGTLLVARTADDLRLLDELSAFQRDLGLDAERLRQAACRELEPMLSPRVTGGVFVRSDYSVQTRSLTAALRLAALKQGVELHSGTVTRVTGDTRVDGVIVSDDRLPADAVVVCAGAWAEAIEGLGDAVPVRPVKGQIARLQAPPGAPVITRTVRGLVNHRAIYMVPRLDGRIVVGATVEEKGFDDTVTAGPLADLLADAAEIVPGVAELVVLETTAGLRPATPDNAPLLGPGSLPGVVFATGHFRNGILLAPVTAQSVVSAVAGEPPPAVAAPFAPQRFGTA